MKLNIECVRDVLLEFESFPMGIYTVQSFENSLSKYGKEDVIYSLFKLTEAEYITADAVMTQDGIPHVGAITDITFQGHEFLANIKPRNNWDKLSGAFKQIGSASFQVVSNVAVELATNVMLSIVNH